MGRPKGSMQTEETKRKISLAYIHAVTSYAGCSWTIQSPTSDIHKIDGLIKGEVEYVEGQIKDTQPELRVQVKSTRQSIHQPRDGDEFIHYSLDIETYEKLRQPHHDIILFVLFVLPETDDQWLNHSEEQLIARKCAYWHSLKGCPRIEGQGHKIIKISRQNRLSPEQLSNLIYKVARKEEIPNGCD